ncbi:unnamed protein product [Danaus chrysippus]|uniref:(African queen) hypothetical protein n=1 Tax=Danaus chrysippus TaxID=151541 RepID=A0A8J2R157_9NEOP|nr:unnamed protein product [Danaus chrysippus]
MAPPSPPRPAAASQRKRTVRAAQVWHGAARRRTDAAAAMLQRIGGQLTHVSGSRSDVHHHHRRHHVPPHRLGQETLSSTARSWPPHRQSLRPVIPEDDQHRPRSRGSARTRVSIKPPGLRLKVGPRRA